MEQRGPAADCLVDRRSMLTPSTEYMEGTDVVLQINTTSCLKNGRNSGLDPQVDSVGII
jgi:hypothetical protein